MKTRIDRQSAVDLAVALVFAAVVALSAFLWNTSGMKGVAPAISPFLVMRPLEMREEVIADYAGVQRVYEFDLTKASGVRAGTLFVHLRHTIAVVEKDGSVVADTGETPSWHIGRTPGNYWLALPIYPEDAGKTLRVTLTPVYQSVRALEPDFLVMDRQMLLHLEVLPDEAAMLLLSCVTAAMGFFLMLLALSLGLTAQDRRRVFYLGAFSCTAGVWKLCGLSVVPLLLDWYGRQKLLWYVGATAYLLMLVLSLRLLTVIQDREHDRLGRLCCYFSAFATLVLLTLQVLGAAELHDALIAFGIAMAGLHLIALLGQKPERAALLWLLPTFAALGLDLVFFSIKGQSPIAPVFLAWVALNLFVRGFGFLRDAIRRERELREKDEQLRGAKMQNLINQIRPHFIYNTLASVSMLCDSDLRFPDAVDSEGKRHPLTNGSYGVILQSPDRALRRDAFEKVYARYDEMKNTLAAILDAQFKQTLFFAQARGYASTLEAALDRTEVPTQVYTQLIEAVHFNLDKLHRYVALRKKLLGLDEVHMYDVYAPIVPDSARRISFDEAKATVLEALAVLGEDYTALLREGFEQRWIDVYENVGKRAGAYSTGTARPHPYVLLNHKDTLNCMFTLAHEMGHALHSYHSCKHQPVCTSDYVIFVAEVASTCNEVLLMRYLLGKTADQKERASLINYFLEQFKGTVYRQTMFAEFELMMGRMAENGETLTAESLSGKYLALNRLYYGENMVSDPQIALEWSRIPHFFYNYYVFQYATGFSAAVAIANRILSEGESAVRDYKRFLSAGSSADPITLLKIAGVDMSSPEPVNSALRLFGELLDEIERLAI